MPPAVYFYIQSKIGKNYICVVECIYMRHDQWFNQEKIIIGCS